jgi:hypothetical protein
MSLESAVSGIGSLASAFGGGGGSSGGGAVVGGPSPQASLQASQLQAQAARDAAATAKQAVNDAILSINKNYQQARYDVQPYRTEGIQALNQLNQYLGLQAYNPGAAPEAPKALNLNDFKAKVKSGEIRGWIEDNSILSGAPKKAGDNRLYPAFIDPTGGSGPNGSNISRGGQANVFAGTQGANMTSAGSSFYGDPTIRNAAITSIAQQNIQDATPQYEQDVSAYNRNQAEWQQNLDWYNKYTAEGPKTQQQITDEISAQPGYSAELNQGVEAIGKSAAARGYVGSGRVLKELSTFGQNTLSKYYNNTLDRLQNLVGVGANAAGATAQGQQQQGQLVGQAKIGLGDTLANAQLASGQALAQGVLSANQQYKVVGQQSSGGLK